MAISIKTNKTTISKADSITGWPSNKINQMLLVDKQVELIRQWTNEDDFMEKLTTQQHACVYEVYRKFSYDEQEQYILNFIRLCWIEYIQRYDKIYL